ncbi:hypothetical protein HJC23_004627 [Cyclotella cryptica]|uniref:Uncharacterized protein n=1 Tax=Cyclotella cryptica TaxID=29204 RepID=A0ABD3QGE0_9STRA
MSFLVTCKIFTSYPSTNALHLRSNLVCGQTGHQLSSTLNHSYRKNTPIEPRFQTTNLASSQGA